MSTADLLIEIGCEELPAKAMPTLIASMEEQLQHELKQQRLSFRSIKPFITPRRMAVMVESLAKAQPDYEEHKLGPMVSSAFTADGQARPSAIGFAKSCGLNINELNREMTDKGERLSATRQIKGKPAADLLPDIIQNTIKRLVMPKPMRWGNHSQRFLRPIHWSVVLLDDQQIPVDILGSTSGQQSLGHRVMGNGFMTIGHARDYANQLKQDGKVIACFNERRSRIEQAITQVLPAQSQIIPDQNLLDEVTGLVEWPVACLGQFDPNFLNVPSEVLISAMKGHQKYFPVFDAKKQLLPQFIFISNIESEQPQHVVKGNERVLTARLSDAQFFYEKDKKIPLSDYLPDLDQVIFQQKLGSMGDKIKRLQHLAAYLSQSMGVNASFAERAAMLCKCDLSSSMVNEFPELQGIMGYHYALAHQETPACASAIKEHYLPRFSGDKLPSSSLGATLSLADRLDNIVGMIGIGDAPTGDKDPYALRRQAYGLIRILSEQEHKLDLTQALLKAIDIHGSNISNDNTLNDCLQFINDRLKQWYLDKDFTAHAFQAVAEKNIVELNDFYARMHALREFMQKEEASCLSAANKRANQILKKQASTVDLNQPIDPALLQQAEELTLFTRLEQLQPEINTLCQQQNYQIAMTQLADLKSSVDQFFDSVMVMDNNLDLQHNRLRLLHQLRLLLCMVADISYLSGQ